MDSSEIMGLIRRKDADSMKKNTMEGTENSPLSEPIVRRKAELVMRM